jgi:hypothetical protein
MRKRLIIGAIAVVVVGVPAYFLWEPGKGTVEYHVETLRKDHQSMEERDWLMEHTPRFVGNLIFKRKAVRMKRHRDALVGLGFLHRMDLVVTNASADDVMGEAIGEIVTGTNKVDWTFFGWDPAPTKNVVRFVALPADSLTISNLVRKVDVPKTK